jgi:signal transduction histidine kinase/CheY-like chemotaxis protein
MHETPEEHGAKILVVDDNPTNLDVLMEYLKEYGYRPVLVRSGETALRRVHTEKPDLILLDILMPGMNGLEVCKYLQADPETQDIPVIFMTALANEEDKLRGFEVGGVDYLTKPVQQAELIARLRNHLRMRRLTASLRTQNEILEVSNQIGQEISTILEIVPLMEKVLHLLSLHFEYYFIGVWTVEELFEEFTLLAYNMARDQRPFAKDYRLSFSTVPSIILQAYRTQRPYLIRDIATDPLFEELAELPDTRSELALPLRVGDKVVGVLDLHGDRVDAFSEDEQRALQLITNQIAIALRNAQLYSETMHFNDDLARLVAESTEELHQAYQHLEKIDKAKSDFIQVAAHELRTPITVMKGYTQVLESRLKSDPDSMSLLSFLLTGIQRLTLVVNSMLDVAKVDAKVVKILVSQVRIVDVVDRAQAELEDALKERQITFLSRDLAKLPFLQLDPELIYKAFNHLVINAIKFTPDGGTITVSGRITPAEGGRGEGIEVLIQDTGIGIDPGNVEAIFEKFYQTGSVSLHSSSLTKFKGGGAGLGLAIARGIIQAHKGKLWAESPGHDEENCPGSTFHIWLPVT